MSTATRWVLASGNAGKLAEMRALLVPLAIDLVAQSDFDVPEAEETGIGAMPPKDGVTLKDRFRSALLGQK